MTEEELKEFAEMLKQTSLSMDTLLMRLATDSLTYARMDGMSLMAAFISQILSGERPFAEIKAVIDDLKKTHSGVPSSPAPNRNGNLN